MVWCKSSFFISDYNIYVRAFPLWGINIYQQKKLIRKNVLPSLRRKSVVYWMSVSFLTVTKLLTALAFYIGNS